jgi:hypothetical protein
MTQEQIAREEFIAREDLLLGAELIGRINSCRQRLRNRAQPLAASEIRDLYGLLGQCTIELSNIAHAHHQDQIRIMSIGRLLQQMSTPEIFSAVGSEPETVAAD